MNNSPGSPDIRSFFKKSNRDPLYELQPDSELIFFNRRSVGRNEN